MKAKQLLPLVVILAVLAGLVWVKQAKNKPPKLEEQYELKTLLPSEIDTAKISKIEMYAGAKPDQKLTLERDGDAWKISSRWDAPVSKDKMDKFLKTLSDLKGEFRATVAGDGQKEYNVDDASGFHVFGYGSDAKELFHLINGKSPDFGLAFVRAAGNDDVYQINVSLRREAGIYTLEMGDAPEPGVWLDKTAFETTAGKIKAVTLNYPDKELAIELKDKPAEEKKADAPADANPADAAKPEDAAKPAEPTKMWAVTKGGLGVDLNQNAGSNLARRLSRINATDLVDPAKKAEYGLDAPKYKATVTIDGESAPVVIEAGRPAGDTYAYIRFPARAKDLVYKISGFDFEQIFYKGGEFFELPGVLVDKSEVDSIEYTTGGHTTKLAKEGEAWKLTEPQTDIAVQQPAIDDLVRTLLAWKAEDYADSADGKGLDGTGDKVVFRGPKVEHTIELGGASATEGRYARLDGGQHVLVMSKADVPAILVPYAKLFDAKIFATDSTSIRKAVITKGDQTARLERNKDDSGWDLAIGDAAAEPANSAKADEVIGAIAGLVADDFDFSGVQLRIADAGSVTFTTADGTEYRFTIAPPQNDKQSVYKDGGTTAYRVSPKLIDNILVDFATLKPAPAPAAPAATPAPADGAAAAPAPAAPAAEQPAAAAPAAPAEVAPATPAPAAPQPAPANP